MQRKDEGRKLISRSRAAENEMNYEQKRDFFFLYPLSKQRESGTENKLVNGGSGEQCCCFVGFFFLNLDERKNENFSYCPQ